MSRAKRAKSNLPQKLMVMVILLIVIAGMLLGLIVFGPEIETKIAGVMGSEVKTYDSSNYVKDVFTESETKYLPIKVDNTYQTISASDIIEDFKNCGITVRSMSSNIIGTGTTIQTEYGQYTILMYGDVNGDGQVNVLDAQCIVKHILPEVNYTLSDIGKKAANIEDTSKDVIDILDALKIVQFVLNKKSVIGEMPTSDLSKDNVKPVILLDGEPEVTVNLSTNSKPTTYQDAGVTAYDNVDHTVKSKVEVTIEYINGATTEVVQAVDTSRLGDYRIRYNVSDLKGNKADEVTRMVHVVNYVTQLNVVQMPDKVDYAKGDPVDLTGLIAEATYADGTIKTISAENVTCDTINVDTDSEVPETQELKIDYEGESVYITITVTPHIPIIKCDETYLEYVGVNDIYRVPRVYALDDETLEELEVTVEFSGILSNGTIIPVDNCQQGDELNSKIVTSDIGTKYLIKYTATNARGYSNTLEKTITVVDVIENIEINNTATNLAKANYIDGEDISLDGLVLTATLRSKDSQGIANKINIRYDKLLDTEHFVLSNTKARYQETVNVEYVMDKYFTTKDKVVYISNTNSAKSYSAGPLNINVVRKLQSAFNPSSLKGEGDIYTTYTIAKIKAKDGEEAISINGNKSNIDIEITHLLGENVVEAPDYKAKVWAVESTDGYVEIKCAVSEPGNYNIVITPHTLSPEGYREIYDNPVNTELKFEATEPEVPSYLSISEFKLEGEGSNSSSIIKSGDTIYADITYKRNYTNTDLGVTNYPVNVNAIWYNDYNIDVSVEKMENGEWKEISSSMSANSDATYKLLTDENHDASTGGRVSRIAVTINKDLDVTSTYGTLGTRIRVQLDVYSKSEPMSKMFGNNSSATVYNRAYYTLTVGDSGSADLILGLTSYNAGKYPISKIGDKYYTLVPVYLKDQHSKANEYIPVTNDMLDKDAYSGNIGGFKVAHYNKDGIASNPDLIEVIGVVEENDGLRVATGNETISKIGIAVSDAVRTQNDLTALRTGKIKVEFGKPDRKDRCVNNIEGKIDVITSPANGLIVTSNVANITNPTCFMTLNIASLQSDSELRILKANQIGIKVSGNNKTYNIKTQGDYNTTRQDVGFTAEEAENGTISLKFWAAEESNYIVTPYVIGGNDGTSVTVAVRHNNTVNHIVIDPSSSTDTQGSVALYRPRGGFEYSTIKFYHDYNNTKYYEINGNKLVPNTITITLDKSIYTDWKVIPTDNKDDYPYTEEPITNGKQVIRANLSKTGDTVDGLYIEVGEDIPAGTTLKFNISVGDESKDVSVSVVKPNVSDTVQIGSSDEQETITIYETTIPSGFTLIDTKSNGDKVYKSGNTFIYQKDGLNYTLLPITTYGGVDGASDYLTNEYLNTEYEEYEGTGKTLSFIDEANDGFSVSSILVLGFKVEGNTVTLVENDTDTITHVGVAVWDDSSFETLPDDTNILLIKVNVYYRPIENSSTQHVKWITIQAVK